MTGAFGWHLPIWWGTSLPDIGWLAFHSPYSFYYSRNDSGSSDAQKMRLKIGEKVFGHTKKGGAFRLHHNGNFCYSSFACFHFPLTGEMQLRTWTSRTRRWRFHFPLTGEMQHGHLRQKGKIAFSFPAHGRDATVPYPLQAVLCFDTPVCANRLLLLFGTVFFSCSEMMLDACSRTEPANIFSLSL